ncbi:MAG: hypothetical protein DRP70_04940 [Spirochaetes bacterium]|nr:MAG: hypothetical protein DRP70_04940 [Spirochaetota bacterium]
MYIGGWRNVLNGWDLKDDLFRAAGELPPKRIRLSSRVEEGGASARFRAPSFPRPSRHFGISIEILPEIWRPAGTRRGFPPGPLHLPPCHMVRSGFCREPPSPALEGTLEFR